MVEIADNFQRQYSHLFPERRPLLLSPENENGVEVPALIIKQPVGEACVFPSDACPVICRSLCRPLFGPQQQSTLSFTTGGAAQPLWRTSCP